MTLVERFIEFNRWPTSRKTALLAGLILPLHLLGWLVAHFAYVQMQIVDIVVLDWFQAAWCAVVALSFLISLTQTLAGKDGRWTAYVFMVLYVAFVVTLIYLFGSASSSLAAIFTVIILTAPLIFDERIAWVSLLFGLGAYVLVGGLESWGVLPYAPILLERSIDAQRNDIWLAIGFYVVFNYLLFNFALSIFIIRTRQLQEARLNEAQKLIRRYLPSQLADKIIKGEHSEVFKPERAKLTVFFSDVEGFTDASDRLDPEELATLLNEYLSEMMAIAERYGATINQIVGDGIMAFFGAPGHTSDKDHALRAVRMALEMQQRMVELKDVWVTRGIEKPFRARIGINTGHASVGDYGSPGRKLYSAIGVQTNLAARIQAHCEPGKALISHSTWALIHDDIACADKGELQLKGVHYPVRVYEVS